MEERRKSQAKRPAGSTKCDAASSPSKRQRLPGPLTRTTSMSFDAGYVKARERWSLKNQVMDDDKTQILSPIKVQTIDACCYFAMAVTLESNLRVQCKRNVILSIHHLQKLDDDSKIRMPYERVKVKRLLSMVKSERVFEEHQYEQITKGKLQVEDAREHKIANFRAYSMKKEDIKLELHQALHQLRSGGPLLAVIQISDNYHDCYKSGLIYRYDPNRAVVNDRGLQETHAVSVVSFGIEANMPFLECQDSRGEKFSRRGFLCVDITSVVELYSIIVG